MNESTHEIAWARELETGNDLIDTQHKQLVKLSNDLIVDCKNNKNPDILSEALKFLVSYAEIHFSYEEKLQVEHKYPDYVNHKQLHEAFKASVLDLIHQYIANQYYENLLSDIQSVLVDWLLTHFKQEDFKIAEHIRKTAAGK